MFSGIFPSTIKNNITFCSPFHPTLFHNVIHATALDEDLPHLSNGINTMVGDQGLMLSGVRSSLLRRPSLTHSPQGQKARVNMARALYRDADIYLLDDPLSAVDTKVSKHLFDK